MTHKHTHTHAECCQTAELMPLDLWDVVREASMKLRKVLQYEQYVQVDYPIPPFHTPYLYPHILLIPPLPNPHLLYPLNTHAHLYTHTHTSTHP